MDRLTRIIQQIWCKIKFLSENSIQSIREGDNIVVDNTDPLNPIISASGQITSGLESILEGENITIDYTDPKNPIISSTGGGSSGTLESITPGSDNVIIDDSDPANPIITVIDNGLESVQEGGGITVDSTDPKNPIISALNQGIETEDSNSVIFSGNGMSDSPLSATIEGNTIQVPSATYSELGITVESSLEQKKQAISEYLEGFENKVNYILFFQIKDN